MFSLKITNFLNILNTFRVWYFVRRGYTGRETVEKEFSSTQKKTKFSKFLTQRTKSYIAEISKKYPWFLKWFPGYFSDEILWKLSENFGETSEQIWIQSDLGKFLNRLSKMKKISKKFKTIFFFFFGKM